MNEIKLEEKTLTELKALAFDELVILERVKYNLSVINQEIAKREQESATEAQPK